MKTIQLKVDHYYRRADGQIVKIVTDYNNLFGDEYEDVYTSSGKSLRHHAYNLIEELPLPGTPAEDETNPKDRLGIKKVQLNLVPASSIIYQALAMEDGAAKYGPYNWRDKKVKASIYVAACLRHLSAWYDSREELAEDSQKPHLGHAIACLGILIDALETGNLLDDRPTPGASAALIKKWSR